MLQRVGHRIGVPPTLPAAGTNRRGTAFGSVEVFGRGRGEVVCATPDSAAFPLDLDALDQRHQETGREVFLALDHRPCHTSRASQAALAQRTGWLHVLGLATDRPKLSKKEREWRYLQRDVRGHLARTRRGFVDEILAGLTRLGGERLDLVDRVPDWFLAGHRRPPTGRPRGRPRGAKDSVPRAKRCANLPAPT